MDIKGKQSKALLNRLFQRVPRLSPKISFIEIQLDNCKVYIPVNNIKEELVDPFVKTVIKLYKETQKESKK